MITLKQFKVNNNLLIKDTEVLTLKPIVDSRGYLMEMIRADDPNFAGFGQAYIIAVNENSIKGWHYHKQKIDTFICVSGMIKLVLFDIRESSPTHGIINEFFLGNNNPLRVQIPTGVVHGIKGINPETSLVVNVCNKLYNSDDPDKFTVDFNQNDFGYDWSILKSITS